MWPKARSRTRSLALTEVHPLVSCSFRTLILADDPTRTRWLMSNVPWICLSTATMRAKCRKRRSEEKCSSCLRMTGGHKRYIAAASSIVTPQSQSSLAIQPRNRHSSSVIISGQKADNVGKTTVKLQMYERRSDRRGLTRTRVPSFLSYITVPILINNRTPSRRNPSYRSRLSNSRQGGGRHRWRTFHHTRIRRGPHLRD